MTHSHFYYMTTQTNRPDGGLTVRTDGGAFTPDPGDTRATIFLKLLTPFGPNTSVLAFDIQPNKI